MPRTGLLSAISSGARALNQEIQITDQPDGEDVQRVLSGLREYNSSHVKSEIRDIGVFVRDKGQDFYLELGFEVFGEIKDHPQGGRRYFLSKRL